MGHFANQAVGVLNYTLSVQREEDARGMRRGPYYDAERGELRIPSYTYFPEYSPVANAEWKRRGLRYDGKRQEWWIAVPAERAQEQVAKCAEVYYRMLRITPLTDEVKA
jgi:hypothetical protein